MEKLKILAVGCSMTRGHGLDLEQDDPKLWVNTVFGPHGTVKNMSDSGRNNQWIFLETQAEIIKNLYDIVIVGWSSCSRYNFNAGLELYYTVTQLVDKDVNVNPSHTYKGNWLKKIGDSLRVMHNDHWDILDLVKYVNALVHIQETCNRKKIFFVNTLSPWSQEYFEHKKITLPSELTKYEQQLLQAETRDDAETIAIYNMIQSQYSYYGGIKESNWLNLYNSLRSMQIDQVSPTDEHPGYQSQEKYFEYFTPILKRKLGIN
jgi:hypothetical protein